jgi:hypothetical protein
LADHHGHPVAEAEASAAEHREVDLADRGDRGQEADLADREAVLEGR